MEKKTAKCMISVEQQMNAGNNTYKTPKLTTEVKAFDKFSIRVSSTKAFDGFDLYVNGKYNQTVIGTTKNQFVYGGTAPGFQINKKYKVKVRPYSKKNGTKKYQKFSNEQTVLLGKTDINVIVTGKKEITVKWKKLSGATAYEIFRATKKTGKYKSIKKTGSKKERFTDKTVKTNKTYYYKVRVISKKRVGKASDIKKGKTHKLKTVEEYLAKKNPNICMDKDKNINSYNINGYYSPIKYRYAKGVLQIHVYLEFVTYERDAKNEKLYHKKKASVQSEIPTSQYISMFKQGVIKAYSDKTIIGNKMILNREYGLIQKWLSTKRKRAKSIIGNSSLSKL